MCVVVGADQSDREREMKSQTISIDKWNHQRSKNLFIFKKSDFSIFN